jgi:hypothetical protein
MKTYLLAFCIGLSAIVAPLSAQVAPKAPADGAITPDEVRRLQAAMAKATAATEAKAADENLRKAREDLAKATQAYQASVEKAAIEADPTTAQVIEKAKRLQQEAVARRNAGNPTGTPTNATAPRQAPRVAASVQGGQTNAEHNSGSAIPRPSELLDNWTAVGLLISLGVIVMLLMRKRT